MKKRRKGRIVLFAVTLLISVVWILPLLITVRDSLIDEAGKLSLVQYKQILIQTPVVLRMFWNSVKITAFVLIGCIVVSLLGAYGFTVLRFRGKEVLFFLYLVVMLLPLQVTLMPNYMVASFFNMEDSHFAIILPAIFQPFGVFLLRQQMRRVPQEYMEAARIDGAGEMQLFFHIYLPLVKSGIAALLMLLAIEYWNLIDQAVIFIRDADSYPLSVFLARVNESAESVSAAAAVFYSIPILAALFYGQEALKEGIGLLGTGDR